MPESWRSAVSVRFYSQIIYAGMFCASVFWSLTAIAQEHHSSPLLNKQDLVYAGAFRVPGGGTEDWTLAYGGSAITFNPNNDSMFLIGHIHRQRSVEISIPALVNSNNLSDLNTATVIQNFTDAYEGRRQSVNPSDPNSQDTGGQLVFGNRLYLSVYSYYDGAGTQSASHFSRPLDLSETGDVVGPVKVGTTYPGFVSGYMGVIPQVWREEFGGPALTGNFGIAIAGRQSWGPAASVFDPTDIDSGSAVPAVQVVGYPSGNGVLGADYSSTNPYFNGTTRGEGIVFPEGSRSVLFFGRHGTGNYCYGTGATCGDPADADQGTHAHPYVYQVWAYDALDLIRVAKGYAAPSAIQPYSVWTFNMPFEGEGKHEIGGVAYDRLNETIYISQLRGERPLPIIHAFRISPRPRPEAPDNLIVE